MLASFSRVECRGDESTPGPPLCTGGYPQVFPGRIFEDSPLGYGQIERSPRLRFVGITEAVGIPSHACPLPYIQLHGGCTRTKENVNMIADGLHGALSKWRKNKVAFKRYGLVVIPKTTLLCRYYDPFCDQSFDFCVPQESSTIEYPRNKCGYRLWDEENIKIITAIDVIFSEETYSETKVKQLLTQDFVEEDNISEKLPVSEANEEHQTGYNLRNRSEYEEEMDELLTQLGEEFKIITKNNPKCFLGIEIVRNEEEILLTRDNYAEQVMEKYKMTKSKPVSTTIVDGSTGNQVVKKETEIKFPYREAIRCLIYLVNKTRPDIKFAVEFEGSNMHEPTRQDVVNIKRTLRFLKQTENFGY
ncbi:hypothetical protein LAZ67_2003618 [Cordylochernes scorpioides]|uniref:Reverse transcriptase Ty1/copia-type domain-containing protein n=1 Tax=Cordylochernes scorpioides TaxID=51811 RepID=A0ABY6K3A4_9ARAC|nr:hypothetical protein LAZ67_2003618 [Cordylochernes scorpioides]